MDQNMNMGTSMPQEKTPMGVIISVVAVVLVLAFVTFYVLKQAPTTQESTEAPTNDATVSALSAQGTSTDITDIEKDLNAANISTVDVGLSDISL
jgi:flagellar basal body-associated protein FliL